MRLQTVYFQSDYTSTFNAMCVLMKSVLHASAKKQTKRLKCFKCRIAVGRFQATSWQRRG